jgi:branched-chain amino acid transport system substrate-binding protein
MFCTECGAENVESAQFCIKCGTRLIQPTVQPPSMPAWLPAEARSRKGLSATAWVGLVVVIALLCVASALVTLRLSEPVREVVLGESAIKEVTRIVTRVVSRKATPEVIEKVVTQVVVVEKVVTQVVRQTVKETVVVAGTPRVIERVVTKVVEKVVTPTPSPVCRDEWGCVIYNAGEPIRIGYSFVISGPDELLGTDTKRGVEMAAEEKGKILGHAVEVIGEDSQCNPEGGRMAAIKLAADEKIVAVIGTNCSSAARAALPILCKANITTVSPSNTAVDLTLPDRPPDYHCYLRTSHSDKVQGVEVAHFAWERLGIKKAATIHDGSLYADKLQQTFAEEFKELGGTVTAQEAVGPRDTDMRSMLIRIAATQPDFIYYPVFIAAGGHITRQARKTAGLENTILMGSDGMFSPDFWEAAGPAAVGMYHSSPDFSAFGADYQDFLTRHEAKYGEPPLAPFHAHAYDAAMIIFAAIERVVVDEGGTLYIGRKALRDALFATKDFKGLTAT